MRPPGPGLEPTNTEMRQWIADREAFQLRVLARLGKCCGRRQGIFCSYLSKVCPDAELAIKILQQTRGTK